MIPRELSNGARSCAGAGSVTSLVISRGSSRKSGRLLCLCFPQWQQETGSDFAGTPADPGDKELQHSQVRLEVEATGASLSLDQNPSSAVEY